MTKRMTAADLIAARNGTNGEAGPNEPQPAEFQADTLALQVTAPDGTVVFECNLVPRGFKPKERRGQVTGGVGWFMEQLTDAEGKRQKILGEYVAPGDARFPVSANAMLFLDGVKVPPGTEIDLRNDSSDGE